MRKKITFIFSLFSILFFAQYEQLSLDFFAKEVKPKIKNAKIFYDGKVIEKSQYENFNTSADETLIDNYLFDYFSCKQRTKSITNSGFNAEKEIYVFKNPNVKNSTAENLIIPNKLIKKKNLNWKKRTSNKLKYSLEKILKIRYNLKVSPSIQINETTYLTKIFITKNDYEFGMNYTIIAKDGLIIDWCETYWIQ